MTAGTRRNGSSTFGSPIRPGPGDRGSLGRHASPGGRHADSGGRHAASNGRHADSGGRPDPGRAADTSGGLDYDAGHYTGRHVSARPKTAPRRAGKAVPAAAVAATLAAGAAVCGLAANDHPQVAAVPATLNLPVSVNASRPAGRPDAAAAPAQVPSAVATGTASMTARPRAAPKTSAAPAASPSVTPSPALAATSRTRSSARSEVPASPSATPTASASPTRTAAATLSCTLSGGLLPENVTAIVGFLVAHGYPDNAAAGIAGNIYQESKGDPESEGMGGGGLIGWTPLPSGFVTGSTATDLQTQLAAIVTYNQQWASYLPALDAAASPADAAYIYVTDFERAGIPAASTREASAADVAAACGI